MEDLAAVIVLNELVDSDDEKPTRLKTRKWIRRKKERGYFTNIIQELIVKDRHGFREMFQMDVADFEFILSKISDLISPKEKLGGTRPIESDERLALSFLYRISMSVISYIVKGCCKAVVERLTPDFIKVLATKAEWLNVSKRFEDRWNYPHALGAIDGKHVRIQKLKNGGSFYYNYKNTHSIILMAIAGRDYECLYADVGSGIWNNCALLQRILNGTVELPADGMLQNGENVPYAFLGDDAFALKEFLMKPFPQQGLNEERRIYNYRHSRARRISENLFGILANRWRIFFSIINLEPEYVEDFILTSLTLHNMLIKSPNSANVYRPHSFVDAILEDGEIAEGEWRAKTPTEPLYFLEVPRRGHNVSLNAKAIRETFMDYSVNDGAVDWQWKYC